MGADRDEVSAAQATAGIEALYPFLYAEGERDVGAVLEEVRRSTAEKAAEIVELRRSVLEREAGRLAECAAAMAARFSAGGRLYAFGNGGSSTDAQEVATTFLHPPYGRPLPALSLTSDVAVVTALSNDVGFEVVFSRQIGAFGKPGDVAFGLSTSGGSGNVIAAFEEAGRRGMLTVGLAGYSGGKMAELEALDYLFVIPSASVHRIQEAQTTIYHALWELTQRALAATASQEAAVSR
ncbi:MAG: SIS domain-containing protein [Streptosporangiales bacterium]|nr:SIS domain-containing protein [Streptosporangiales bacterium]